MHIFKCNSTKHQIIEILTLSKHLTQDPYSEAARAEVQNSDIVGKS